MKQISWFIAILIGATLTLSAAFAATPLPAMDLAISKFLGTTRQEEIMQNRIVPYAGASTCGVHIDTSKSPVRYYLFDAANNRILGFKGWQPVTLPNGPYPSADIVIGQPAMWDTGAANGNNIQFLPPSAATLALLPFPYVSSTSEAPRSGMMATDTNGNFYVVDLCNNRVLKYIDPFETDQIADEVWGQTSFTNRSPNNTTTPPATSATTLNTQWIYGSTIGAFSAGVEVDAAGNIWVADAFNNRVLCFTNGAKTATLVFGQTSFTASSSGTALNKMYHPTGVRVHPQTHEVFVLDGQSDLAPGPRVMVFRPPFSNGMSAQRMFGTNQLRWARGFCFDPFDTNIVWVADGGNTRIVKFNQITGQALDCIGQVNLTTLPGVGKYVRADGVVTDFGQSDGSISIDAQTNLYFTSINKVIRIPLPITRNGQGIVWSNGEMLKGGVNENSGRTTVDNYGMARWNNQLFVHDRYRMMVWTNYKAAVDFQSADFVIGQSAMDKNEQYPAGGATFEGRWISMLHASEGSNVLFVTTDWKTFMFRLPITNGGVRYAAFKTIDGGSGISYKWADDNNPCGPLGIGSVCYDPVSNVLWATSGARVLRIRNIFDDFPLVDLVLGQTNKTGSLRNKGKWISDSGPFTVDATDMADPSQVYLDNYRNLYVVDGRYEGGGNIRVVRFNEAKTYPVGGTIFPNTSADAVFCKPNLTTDRTYYDVNRPGTPITLAFNSANEMVLTEDTYSGSQGMHLYFYPTPQQTNVVNPQPTQIINTYLGQPAYCFFDGPVFVLQDHTWARVIFHVPRPIAPLVFVTNTIVTVTSASTALGGTNAHLVGTMQWSNERGGGGAFPATSPWQVTGIALQFGANLLTVSGTNTGGIVGSDAITITRAFLRGEGTPAISITNAPQSFPNGVTSCALGGVANQHAVGYISWSNNRGGSGSVAATSAWVITGIPLGGGANLISVSATNVFGSNAVASITMTRAPGPGEGAPYVDATTPDITVDESSTVYAINGTNNQNVVGIMWWTNALGGGGTLAAVTPWTIPDVPLQLGDNVITVAGSNVYGDVAADSVRIARDTVITSTNWQTLAVTNGMGYAGAGAGLRMNESSTLVKNYDRDGYVYLQAMASAGNPRTQSIWRVRASTLSSMATDAWQLTIGGIPCNGGGGEPGQTWVKCSNVFYAAMWCQFGIPNGGPWYWSWYGFYTTNAAGTPATLGADPATPLIARATGDDFPGAARNIGGIWSWTNVSALNAICTDRYKNSLDAQVRRWSGVGSLTTLSEKETEGVNTAYATSILDPKQNGRALFLDATAAGGQNWIWCATNLFAGATNIQNAERRYQIPGSMTSDAIVDLALLNHPNFYGNMLLAASVWTGSRKVYLYNLERPDLAPLDITPATGLSQWRNTLATHEGYLFMNYDAGSEAPGIMRLSLIDFDLQPIGVPEPGVLFALLAPALLSMRACRFFVRNHVGLSH